MDLAESLQKRENLVVCTYAAAQPRCKRFQVQTSNFFMLNVPFKGALCWK